MDPSSALNSSTPLKTRLTPFERLFVRLLRRLHSGSIEIQFPGGTCVRVGDASMPLQNMQIIDAKFFSYVFLRGSIGFGEAYVQGFWRSSDLSSLLLLLAKNQAKAGRLYQGFSVFARYCNRLYHLARRNTLQQSRKNIQAHYDLSNDFYACFLDPTMTYSSALFSGSAESLQQAQLNKMDRMLDLAGVHAGSSILEIGSGWGALAIRAAQRGCRIKTITLSEQQYALAQQRFVEAGVADQIDLCLQDYRLLDGQFDAVLSCEMIEAVGKQYLAAYFKTIQACLKPGAKAVLQAITIEDERYEQYSRKCDWIQKYIFPGGHLPSIGAIRAHVDDLDELVVSFVDGFGHDYAETLRRWSDRFNTSQPKIQSLGFDAAFCRQWNYYLSYCEAGFDAGLINVNHLVLTRQS